MNRHLLAASLLLVTSFLGSTESRAYDHDTHFGLMNLIARYSGLNHQVAAFLATGDQWVDVSFWTSPMLPVPVAAERQRAVWHFPAKNDHYDLETDSVRYKFSSPTEINC